MRIEQLHYLREIIQWGSFSLAAEQLYISQQSLSESINKLEQEFGIQLLIRSRKGVTLTGPGKIFFKDAEAILAIHERMEATFKDALIPTDNHLHIATNSYFNSSAIPEVLPRFRHKFPELTISLKEYGTCQDVLRKVIANEVDLGLTTINSKWLRTEPLLKEHLNKTFLIRKLGTDSLCALVTKGHPLAKETAIMKDALFKYPLVVDATFQLVQYLATLDKHRDPNILLATSNSAAYFKTIYENNAVGFATSYCLPPAEVMNEFNLTALPLEQTFHLQISAIIPISKPTTLPLRELMKLVDHYYQEQKNILQANTKPNLN